MSITHKIVYNYVLLDYTLYFKYDELSESLFNKLIM